MEFFKKCVYVQTFFFSEEASVEGKSLFPIAAIGFRKDWRSYITKSVIENSKVGGGGWVGSLPSLIFCLVPNSSFLIKL